MHWLFLERGNIMVRRKNNIFRGFLYAGKACFWRRFVSIFVVSLFFASCLFIVSNDVDVVADSGGGGVDDGVFGLDYWYMWNVTQNISNVVHNYPNDMIPKGRAWATYGENYNVSGVFSFFTGYESKINNTGSTNISGYLFMKIDYYDTGSEEWVLEQVVVNETTPRIINSESFLALDTIFNEEKVGTGSFEHKNGTYRVYAAFRDPYGDVLWVSQTTGGQQGSGGYYLTDAYEFTVTL